MLMPQAQAPAPSPPGSHVDKFEESKSHLPKNLRTTMNQHQTNGNPPLANGLPSSGQTNDMPHLWAVIQQLSEALAENRAQNTQLMNGVHQVQARASQDGHLPNGAQVNGETNTTLAQQNAALETENLALRNANASLSSEVETYTGLLDDYETSLKVILDKLRPYAFNHQQALISVHRHYNSLLEQERQERLDQSLEHAKWQAGLGKAANYAREAVKAANEESLPYIAKVAELKYENKVLRKLVGWEPLDDSEDEGDAERKVDQALIQ